MNEQNIGRWWERFNDGRMNVHDKDQLGHPSLFTEYLIMQLWQNHGRPVFNSLQVAQFFFNISCSLLGETVSEFLAY